MAYYFVCDGGGSKTESLLFDEKGRVLASSSGEGANALFLSRHKAVSMVMNQLQAATAEAGISVQQLSAIRLFIPGFGCCEDEVRSLLPPRMDFEVLGDEVNAFYGALGKPEGIAVLSGTGSFAVGRNREGRFVTTGGWGPLMGDQGSGYDIGVSCLRKLAKLADLEICGTILERRVLENLEQPSVLSLRERTSQPDFDRTKIASLCPIVAQAAQDGDPDALSILSNAAAELAELAYHTAVKLHDDTLPVVLIGGVSKVGSIFTDSFRKNIRQRLPNAACGEAAFSPAMGAVLYVLDQLVGADISSPDLISNIKMKNG